MATKELGIVKVVHGSGLVETDKGFKSTIKAEKGDRLIQDTHSKEVTIAPKKTAGKRKTKADKEVVPVEDAGAEDTEATGTDDVAGDE